MRYIPIRPRVPTGIPGLDELIGGGFCQGRTHLVSGETGTGKTIFCCQYLLHGVLNGEPGVFITAEEKPRHIIEDAETLGWHLEEVIDENMMMFLDIASHFGESGRISRRITDRIISDLNRNVKEIGAKRLVIDPIAPLVVTTETLFHLRRYVKNLIFSIDDALGCTTVITSEIPSGTRQISKFGVEELVSSGIIILGLREVDYRITRTLLVRKMRGTPVNLAYYSIDIIPEKGVVVIGPCT